MPNWNTVKIKYQKEQENGALKTIVESYLIDAVSFTDAEARTFSILTDSGLPDFTISSIAKARYTEVLNDTESEHFYAIKYAYTTINEISQSEKRVVHSMLIRANDIDTALANAKKEFDTWLIPIDIEAAALTPILEVYPYVTEE